jgi:heme-degrading monooxygenase HmoA
VSAFKSELSRRTFIASSLVGVVTLTTLAPPAHSQNRSVQMEPTIRVDTNITTLVTVFIVEPENQQKLVDALKGGADEFFSKAPGFISASVLKSKDGRRVINYSQWRSANDVAAFRQAPYFGPYLQRLKALSIPESIDSEVVYANHA